MHILSTLVLVIVWTILGYVIGRLRGWNSCLREIEAAGVDLEDLDSVDANAETLEEIAATRKKIEDRKAQAHETVRILDEQLDNLALKERFIG